MEIGYLIETKITTKKKKKVSLNIQFGINLSLRCTVQVDQPKLQKLQEDKP